MKDKLRFLKVIESNLGDLAQGISELYFSVHKRKRDFTYWKWRYLNDPGSASSLISAVSGCRIVGKYGLLYIPFLPYERV